MSVPSFDCFRENKSNPHVRLCPSNMWQELLAAYLPYWICGSIIFFSPPDSIVSYVNWEFAGAAGVKQSKGYFQGGMGALPSNHSAVLCFLWSGFQHLFTGLLPHLPGWCLPASLSTSGKHPGCQAAKSDSSSMLCCSWEAFNCLLISRDTV